MQHCVRDPSSAQRNANQKRASIPAPLNLPGRGNNVIIKAPAILSGSCTVCYVSGVQMDDLSSALSHAFASRHLDQRLFLGIRRLKSK